MKRKTQLTTFLACLLAVCVLASCGTPAASSAAGGSSASVSSAPAVSTPAEAAIPEETDGTGSGYTIKRNLRETETPMGEEDTWTIFLYVCGTDLESKGSFASINLWQIMQSIPGDNVNVILQTGGTEVWGQPLDAELAEVLGVEDDFATAVVDPSVLQRYEVTDELTLVDEQPLSSMGDQETLYDFLSWGVENYPADKMGVVFWNHGGGCLLGVCVDELFDRDILMPFEMGNAFNKLYGEMTDRFEFIGFDACLMATIEVANILVPHARYMYASEETEPGFGWDYTALIGELNRKPEATGGQVGTVLCDAYFNFNREIGQESSCTLSVTDLAKVDDVLYALDDLALQLDVGLEEPAYFAEVSRKVNRAENYAYDYLVDMGDMADHLADIAPEEATALRTALDEAVVHTVSGGARAFASGLAVYYPTTISSATLARYGMCYPTPAYYDYINRIQLQKLMLDMSGQQLVQVAQQPAWDGTEHYTMQVDPATIDYVREVGFQFFLAPQGNQNCYVLGYDNDILVDYDTGAIQDNFKANWAHLEGQPLMLKLTDFNDEYNLYEAPIMLNGARTNLMLQWTWDESKEHNGFYEILGTFDGTDPYTGMASRATRPLQAGDAVVPLYGLVPYDAVVSEEMADPEEYLDENGKLVLVPGSSVMISEDSEVIHTQLDAGRYLYQFCVNDVFGTLQTYAPLAFDVDAEGAVVHPE